MVKIMAQNDHFTPNLFNLLNFHLQDFALNFSNLSPIFQIRRKLGNLFQRFISESKLSHLWSAKHRIPESKNLFILINNFEIKLR